jgi:hypothetical protein
MADTLASLVLNREIWITVPIQLDQPMGDIVFSGDLCGASPSCVRVALGVAVVVGFVCHSS